MSQRRLHIAPGLSLPLEAVTETFAILAKRGMGKTYTAAVMAEEMLKVGAQIVVCDPVGVWWGLRAAADGKSNGLPIIVMGGEHGDIPLDDTTGAIVAEFVVDTGSSVVLDLGLLRKSAMIRFMTDFAEKLYHAKAPESKRSPLHLFLDEADAFAPQKPQPDQARLLGAMQDLVRRGRARGVGITMITQRSAVLNKDVLTQAEVLVPLRTISPQDRKAIEDWIDIHADKSEADIVLESLPSLAKGTAWFWSPGWLDICQKVNVRRRETFDSSSTPEFGKSYKNIKLSPVDLESLKEKMSATIEKAKQDDPRMLRAQVAELKKQLAKQPTTAPPKIIEKRVEIEVATAFIPPEMKDCIEKINAIIKRYSSNRLGRKVISSDSKIKYNNNAPKPPEFMVDWPTKQEVARSVAASSNGDLSGPEQRILDAIAWMNSIGIDEPLQTAVAFLAGYTVGGGAFNNPRGRLRTNGLIDYRGGSLVLTHEGRSKANTPSMPLDSAELQSRVLNQLPTPEQKILKVLIDQYPVSSPNDDLARASGYEPGGGAFNNPRGRLRTLGLITYPEKGMVKAADLLFIN